MSEKYAHKIVKRVRVRIPDVPGAFGRLAQEAGDQQVVLGDVELEVISSQYMTRNIIMFFNDQDHVTRAMSAFKKLKGYRIIAVEDEVLRIHRGGKVAVTPAVKMETLDDLRMIYTPGVAQVCKYLVNNPDQARTYTSIGNTVCIATNGSAVLGLGDIGVVPGMPVMEGKSVILHDMGKVNCVPLLVDSSDPKRIIDALESLAKTFSVIMIEDIKAPLCFQVEQGLQKRVDIPVFHDDQHGTAIVILASLITSLKNVKKKKEKARVVINGAGAAGIAAAKLMLNYGFKDVIICDRKGAIYKGRKENMNEYKKEMAEITNLNREKGSLADVLCKKDVFVGVSSPGLVSQDMVKSMNKSPIILALANPVPEIWPKDAESAGAAVALDGRTVNNCLAFPGLIRGTLDACASRITDKMKIAAAETIAALSGKKDIVPNFMNPLVHKKIAAAVKKAALKK